MTALFTWLAILLGFIAGWTACSLMAARRRTAELEAAQSRGYDFGYSDAVYELTHLPDAF